MIGHTPTPWIASSEAVALRNPRASYIPIRSEHGGTVAVVAMVVSGNGRSGGNADMIVRAVNAHEALVAALERVDAILCADGYAGNLEMGARATIRAALSLARKEGA